MTSKKAIKILFSFLCAVFFFTILTQFDILRAQTFTASAPDELVISFKKTTQSTSFGTRKKHIEDRTRLKVTSGVVTRDAQELQKINAMVIKVPPNFKASLMDDLKKDDSVGAVEPNYKAYSQSESDDPLLVNQWGLYKINAAKSGAVSAWDITHSSTSVKVAVLDTGIESSHPDLQGKIVLEKNFSSSNTLTDIVGHGTHVAGSIAASTNNAVGVAGVGYNTLIMNGKVLGDDGSGYYDQIASGIIWAADNGAQIINLSLGGSQTQQVLQDAINYAWNKGVVIIAAAGNSGTTQAFYPAFYDHVVSVAATDENDVMPSWSSHGTWVKVAAPGELIYSTYKGGGYSYMRGTSMATSVVSGVAALAEAAHPCSNICIVDSIEKTADAIDGTGTNWVFGRVNAFNAVNYVVTTPVPTVIPTVAPTETPSATPTPTVVTPTNTPTPTPTLIGPTPTIAAPTPTSGGPTPTVVANQMTVSDITMSYVKRFSSLYDITIAIIVKNPISNTIIPNANVQIRLTTPSGHNYTGQANTISSGKVSFILRNVTELGTYKTTITNIVKNSFTYVPTTTSKTLQIP